MPRAMWCSVCRSEVPTDLLTCPTCGTVPEETAASTAPGNVSAGMDVGVCGFEDAANCRGAVAILEAAGIPARTVPQRAEDSPGTLHYWLTVRSADAQRAGELLKPHLKAHCSLCGEPLDEEETVCTSCGEPRG